MNPFDEVFSPSWIKYCGVTYRPGMAKVIDVSDTGLPDFGKILSLVSVNCEIHCVVEKWKAVHFIRHLFAYQVIRQVPHCYEDQNVKLPLDPQPVPF